MQSDADKAVNDLAELAEWSQEMAGLSIPPFTFDNPKELPPCGHCGQTSTRQPWVDEPLHCIWCDSPMCWDCAKVNSPGGRHRGQGDADVE